MYASHDHSFEPEAVRLHPIVVEPLMFPHTHAVMFLVLKLIVLIPMLLYPRLCQRPSCCHPHCSQYQSLHRSDQIVKRNRLLDTSPLSTLKSKTAVPRTRNLKQAIMKNTWRPLRHHLKSPLCRKLVTDARYSGVLTFFTLGFHTMILTYMICFFFIGSCWRVSMSSLGREHA